MANPAYVQAVTAPAGSNVGASVVVKTTNVAVGDTLIALYMGYSSGSITPAAPFPAGWTLVDSDTQIGGGYTLYSATASKIATSADVATSGAPVSYTFHSSNLTSGGEGAIVVFSGGNATPVDAHAVAVVPNGTTATSPSATATASNDVALIFYCDAGNTGATPSLPAGLTNAIAFSDSSNGNGIRAGYADLSATGACPQYTSTFGETVDGSVVFGTMFTVLVKGAGGGSNALAGTSQQNDTASASLAVAKALAGASPQVSFASGALTNAGAGIHLSGDAYQAQVSAGALAVAKAFSGTSPGIQVGRGELAVTGTNAPASVVAHALGWQPNPGSGSPVSTPAMTTPASGSLILVNVLLQTSGQFASLTDNFGNTYTQVGSSELFAGSAPTLLFKCANAVGGANHIISANLTAGYTTDETSVMAIAFNASDIGAFTFGNTGTFNSPNPLTTTASNSAVACFFDAADYSGSLTAEYTPPAGWTKLDQDSNGNNSDSCADAWIANPTAGTVYNPTWTSSDTLSSGAGVWLVEVLKPTAGSNALSGVEIQQPSSAGTLSVAVPLVGVSAQRSNASGSVRVAIQASGTATATQNADGSLSISVPLSASSVQQAIATAALGIGLGLSGTSREVSAASGALSVHVSLAGTQLQQALAAATLTNTAAGVISLVGASGQSQSAAGSLFVARHLQGASVAIAGASGSLAVSVPLSAASVQASRAGGSLAVGIQLTGAGLQEALAQGALSNVGAVDLSGAGNRQQSAQGTLTLQLHLTAESVQQMSAVAILGNSTFTTYVANGRYYAAAPIRSFYAAAPIRSFYATP